MLPPYRMPCASPRRPPLRRCARPDARFEERGLVADEACTRWRRRCPSRMVNGMHLSLQSGHDIAESAHELQRAAGALQQRASSRDTVPALPSALAHLEEALDRLATSMVKTAQTVEEWAGAAADADLDRDALSPDARALRWHLFHLAARLRGAQDACPDARRWARTAARTRTPASGHLPREGSV